MQFSRILGFFPDNIAYYQLAVRHRSVTPPAAHGYALSNERLEFLGDAVLNSVVTDILFRRYTHKREGFLTNTRSKVVNREFLNQIALEMGLDKLVQKSRYFNQAVSSNIYGNAFEALIGAIYLDQGYKQCRRFVEKRFFRVFVDLEKVIENESNYKSKMIEFCQKHHLVYEYKLLEEVLAGHGSHIFTTALLIGGKEIARATGSSKKDSQQQVSMKAYGLMNENPDFLLQFLPPVEEETENGGIPTEARTLN